MYFDQLADNQHYYYLQFDDGKVVRGVCPSHDHLLILVLFYYGIISEVELARRVRTKMSDDSLDPDMALSAAIAERDDSGEFTFPTDIEEFKSAPGISWDAARYKLRHHDWLKQQGGLA